jgi:hypothetical protein
VHTKGWDNPVIYHWESPDMVKWSGGPLAVVEPEKVRAWAPEFTYVPSEDFFYVYWSSLHNGHNTIYYSTTRDWKDVVPARSKVFYDIGIHDIDLTIVEHGGIYYGFHKPGDVNDMMNNMLMTTPTLHAESKDFGFGKNGAGTDVLSGASKPIEGPEVIRLIGQDKWYVYGDPFNSPMEAWETSDFKTFSKITVKVPPGAKHCGLVAVTEEELQTLLAAYPFPGKLPPLPDYNEVVPTSRFKGVNWRFTLDQPAADWVNPAFNDLAWKEGPGGFGTAGTPGAVVRTEWKTDDIWLRREFDWPSDKTARRLCWFTTTMMSRSKSMACWPARPADLSPNTKRWP